MDPLSITVAVTGLIGAASAVRKVLSSIISNAEVAPRMLSSIFAEIGELRTAAASLQGFVQDASQLPRHRTCLISLEQLVATITEAVLTVSELEKRAQRLGFSTSALISPLSLRSGVRAIQCPSQFPTLLERLQRNKASLNLMLTVIRCEAERDALHSQKALHDLIKKMLLDNSDLRQRVARMEQVPMLPNETASLRTLAPKIAVEEADAITPSTKLHDTSSPVPALHRFQFDFEPILEASWVYRRSSTNESDASFKSSVMRSHAWSSLSELSLAQISLVSVIALPIQPKELSGNYWSTDVDGLGVKAYTSTPSSPDKPLPPADRSVAKDSTRFWSLIKGRRGRRGALVPETPDALAIQSLSALISEGKNEKLSELPLPLS